MSPTRPLSPCGHPFCPGRAVPGTGGRCESHRRDRWAGRASVTERGYGHAWRLLRAKILARDAGLCTRCGASANQVDHIQPKHKGGTDDTRRI